MMIFISLSELLDGIRIFLTNQNQRIYHFVGVGCSFQFIIVKLTSNQFRLINLKSEIVDEMTRLELIKSVWDEVRKIVLNYDDLLNESEFIKSDLTASIEEFREQFHQ